jgi:hypothetical protein
MVSLSTSQISPLGELGSQWDPLFSTPNQHRKSAMIFQTILPILSVTNVLYLNAISFLYHIFGNSIKIPLQGKLIISDFLKLSLLL